jgi:membrane protease YdiL (CAAX protease family)
MNALWNYFWPAFAAGLLLGGIAGSIAFRRRSRRNAALAVGFLASILVAGLWHGPFGAADRFATQVERSVRQTLVYYEMTRVTAHLHHDPLTRRIILSGPADDFQTSELVRIMGDLPGVSSAQWSSSPAGTPLIIEGGAVALLGFLFGLLLAYLVELRRRYNAQWNW